MNLNLSESVPCGNTSYSYRFPAGFGDYVWHMNCLSQTRIVLYLRGEPLLFAIDFTFVFSCMIICDADMLIKNMVSKWPGCSHDFFILEQSGVSALMEMESFKGMWLLDAYTERQAFCRLGCQQLQRSSWHVMSCTMCIRNNVVLEEDDSMEDDEERDVDERPHPANESGIQTRHRLIEILDKTVHEMFTLSHFNTS
ncbi:hypothetical protein CAPTEDRAFT_214174 [Capitella teleta]|uniref:Uncharacterized protein n=1 Tax=Capitella teleta TaxID=283909 RepID=R7TKJ6_CAPTE|nr:hypothetical protein CAPTEDRAFT_214174 [Capitella teleta]|eukprot:ELT94229.1 hypothetical protein CAPTEDRAFT_214174 [Capitella teleta]